MPILSKAAVWIAIVGLSSATMTLAATPDAPAIEQRDATIATRTVLEQAARDLPAEDGQDFEFAQRGFIASWPDAMIRQDNGRPAFDLSGNDFVDGDAPDTVHPSLWRQNRVLRAEGFWVPQWYNNTYWVAYYDQYDHPENLPRYALGETSIWWYDAEKGAALKASGALK